MNWLHEFGKAYSVRIIKRGGRILVQVSFEIKLPELDHMPNRLCSMDSNPEGFAAAIVARDGNLLAHRFFGNDRILYASAEKREDTVGKLVVEIIDWAVGLGAEAFATESLNIKGNEDFGRRTNRIIYAWVRHKFAETIQIKCWKKELPVLTVNPAYTSKIGKAKYAKRLGLSAHEAAALCIGRRAYGHDEKLPEPMPITVKEDGVKVKVPVMCVWASIYGHGCSVDLRMAPPWGKGNAETRPKRPDKAVFTGRPTSQSGTPPSMCGEGVRKGWEPGENPGATGYGVKPAPPNLGGGDASATSLRIRNDA